jgi:peroxiredoxin
LKRQFEAARRKPSGEFEAVGRKPSSESQRKAPNMNTTHRGYLIRLTGGLAPCRFNFSVFLTSQFLLLLLAAPTLSEPGAHAQDVAQPLSLVDIKGTKHLPLDAKGVRAVVFFFVVADCPIANYYTSEINAIVKDHAGKPVRFFVVHVDPDLTPAAAQAHAKEYGITCPVLIDAKHQLVKTTGATITPEAAILTTEGKIAYRGRIDDRYVELGKRRIAPTRRDVREALTALLGGQPVKEPRTQAIGCPVPDIVPPRSDP